MLHELYQITSSFVDVTTGKVRFFSGTAGDALKPHREVECTAGGNHTITSECETNGSKPRNTDKCEDVRSETVQSQPSYRNALLSSNDCMSTLEPFKKMPIQRLRRRLRRLRRYHAPLQQRALNATANKRPPGHKKTVITQKGITPST